jgi:hypothetical protein
MFGVANESEWTTAKHSLRYLDLADRIPIGERGRRYYSNSSIHAG